MLRRKLSWTWRRERKFKVLLSARTVLQSILLLYLVYKSMQKSIVIHCTVRLTSTLQTLFAFNKMKVRERMERVKNFFLILTHLYSHPTSKRRCVCSYIHVYILKYLMYDLIKALQQTFYVWRGELKKNYSHTFLLFPDGRGNLCRNKFWLTFQELVTQRHLLISVLRYSCEWYVLS